MAKFATTYRDATHTYRLSGRTIIMQGPDGLEHRFIRDTPDQARAHMRAIIEAGQLRKEERREFYTPKPVYRHRRA